MRGKKITEEMIECVLAEYPFCYGSNTKFQQCFYEYTCISRYIPISWENIKAIQNEYPIETVMRKRREYVASTPEQMEEGYQTHKEYSKI